MANDNETLLKIAQSIGNLEGSFRTFSENTNKKLENIEEFQLHIKTKWDDGFQKHVQYVETELKNHKKDMQNWLDEKSRVYKEEVLHKMHDTVKPLQDDLAERQDTKKKLKTVGSVLSLAS